jgi:translocation protein SEC63
MVLAASLEFEKGHNGEVQERFSDNVEVPQLIKQLPNLGEKNKERPLCFNYSVKARALLHAHLSRIPLPPNSLELDRQLVIRKCPYLIQEMVTCVSQLIMLAHAGRIARLPSLDTIEAVMKMSPMVVQALWDNGKSPLLQLPHVTEDMQKHFMSKKRQIRSIQQFCEMKDEDRRSIFRNLTDDQYSDIMRVCASMPLIDFDVQTEVLDDEESAVVTAGAIVTVTVILTRNSMESIIKGEGAPTKNKESHDDGKHEHEDAEDDKENKEDGDVAHQPKKPVWQKQQKKGKKSSGSKKNQPQKKAILPKSAKSDVNDTKKEPKQEEEEEEDSQGSDGSGSESDSNSEPNDKEKTQSAPEDDDAEWEKCQSKLSKNKERALEGKSKISHPVHCPYFPDVKQEYWWTYVCDKKTKSLVTAPYLITNLVTREESQLQFTAPRKPGRCQFTVCLRSDSYIGFDQFRDIKLDVQEAKEIEEHPQWDISEGEEEEKEESEESEFASDEDVEDEDIDDDED